MKNLGVKFFTKFLAPLVVSVFRVAKNVSNPYVRVIAAILLLAPLTASTITTDTGKSFFSPQPMSAMLAPQTAMFEEFARRTDTDNERFFFSVTPFYTKSNAAKNLRRYFFPGGKDELLIKGSEAGAGADVSGTWLQIMGNNPVDPYGRGDEVGLLYNDIQSKISVNPVYENLGANLNFYKNLSNKVFIAAEIAVVQSKVTHGFTEYGVQNQGMRLATTRLVFNDYTLAPIREEPESRIYSLNATEAFTNPFRNYGKLATNSIKKTDVSDLAVKLGLHLGSGTLFAKIIVPTSQKPTAVYMFEPMAGNNSHLGLGFGGSLGLEKNLTNVTLRLSSGGEYVYLFENTQLRTFDLTNGAWSRYLLMRDIGQRNSVPGANYLTLSTNVTPGHTVNWQANGGMQWKKLSLNIGYNFFFAQDESLSLSSANISNKFNIATGQLLDGGGGVAQAGMSNRFFPTATIVDAAGTYPGGAGANAGVAMADVSAITASNIQLQSAQQPAKLVSQLGISAGVEDMCCGLPVSFNLGYSYNIDHNRTALEGWSMWAQLGLKV
jgi:hypothetical protein